MYYLMTKKEIFKPGPPASHSKALGGRRRQVEVPPRPLSTPGKRTLPGTVRAASSDPLTNREVTSTTHFAVNA